MTNRIVGNLQDQATVESRVESGTAPDWVAAHWNTFRDGLLGERDDAPFPFFSVLNLSRTANHCTPQSRL